MLVSEIKKAIENYDSKEKDKIIIELYKRIPKSKKEYYDIDDFILNFRKVKEKKESVISFEELENQVNYFLECVKADLYAVPNKIISKQERSN